MRSMELALTKSIIHKVIHNWHTNVYPCTSHTEADVNYFLTCPQCHALHKWTPWTQSARFCVRSHPETVQGVRPQILHSQIDGIQKGCAVVTVLDVLLCSDFLYFYFIFPLLPGSAS